MTIRMNNKHWLIPASIQCRLEFVFPEQLVRASNQPTAHIKGEIRVWIGVNNVDITAFLHQIMRDPDGIVVHSFP